MHTHVHVLYSVAMSYCFILPIFMQQYCFCVCVYYANRMYINMCIINVCVCVCDCVCVDMISCLKLNSWFYGSLTHC